MCVGSDPEVSYNYTMTLRSATTTPALELCFLMHVLVFVGGSVSMSFSLLTALGCHLYP